MILVKPEITIVSNFTGDAKKENYLACLRAAGVCKRKDLTQKGYKYFNKLFQNIIMKPEKNRSKHFAVLQHAFVKNGWKHMNFRDFLEPKRDLSQMSWLEREIEKEKMDEINKFKLSKIEWFLPKDTFQIKIRCNRFTAMQWVRHVSKYTDISFLVESTRAVDYSENQTICTINPEMVPGSILWESAQNSFDWYAKLRKEGYKKEDCRDVTDYRENYMIGTAHINNWYIACSKRIGSGAQEDAQYIAFLIKQKLKKYKKKGD